MTTTLVVGGGVAGAAAACLLGSGCTLFEREPAAHDKVCGEFISWEAQDALARLGLHLPALGGAPIERVRLVHGARVVESALPRPGLGLSRRVLDEALLHLAAARGATIRRGATVRRLLPGGAEVDGVGFVPGRVLLATGKHELRGSRRPPPAAPVLLGFKTYLRLLPPQDAALAGAVEVILFPGGYAGLQHVEGGRANLCLLIDQPRFLAAGATWPGVLDHLRRSAPHLSRRLGGAEPLLLRPVSIARVPYGHLHAPPGGGDPDGAPARLGDQMAVIPSFSGDGMAIALRTALAACAAPVPDYHARMRRELGPQLRRAMLLHRLGLRAPAALAAAASLWPPALSWVARLTRVNGM